MKTRWARYGSSGATVSSGARLPIESGYSALPLSMKKISKPVTTNSNESVNRRHLTCTNGQQRTEDGLMAGRVGYPLLYFQRGGQRGYHCEPSGRGYPA